MLTNTSRFLLVLLLLLFSKSFIYGQYTYPISDGWGVGANIGLDYFYGDVSDDKGRIWRNIPLSGFYYTDKNFMGSINLSKAFNKIWGIRGNFSYGKLSGSDEKTNMYFKGSLYTIDFDATFQYLDYFLKRPESKKYKYYAFAGIGISSFNSIRRDITTDAYQNATGYNINGAQTSFTTVSMLKLGLGVAYQIDKNWLFNFETSLHYLNTDNLDAYKSTSSKLEGYGYMSLGFIYKFDFDINTNTDSWRKSTGTNNRSYNSGLANKRKKKLHNKWKR